MRALLVLSLATLAATPFAASSQETDWVAQCRRWNNRGDFARNHCEQRETRVAARASVTVDAGQNGGVSVHGWDESGMLVRARIQAWGPSEAEAREIASQVRVETQGTLRAEGPAMGNRRGWSVSWDVFVPRRTGLALETHNGGISVENVSGEMELRAVNGPLNLRGVGGDVRGRTQNGPLNVTLSGSRWSGEGLDLETVNGPLTIRLPRDYSAELETGTVNGPINFDLSQPIPVRGRITRRIQTRLGSGGAPIRAVTTNGPVTLRDS